MASNRTRLSPLLLDSLAGIGLFLVANLSLLESGTGGAAFSRDPDGWNVLIIAAMTLPLALRRRFPVAVLGVVTLGFVIDRGLDYPTSLAVWSVAIVLHAVGSEIEPQRSRRVAAGFVAAIVGFTALGAATTDNVSWTSVVIMVAFTVFPYLLGREVHERRLHTASLEQRTAELERRQQEESRRAVRRERQRIARELHDVVAHEMTVMTIQTAAARRMMTTDLERARAALEAVEAAGHEALNEMRRLLDVLRPQPSEANRTPQPGLSRLDDLVEQMRDAGLGVAVTVAGEPRTLPPGVDLNAYRIIQESLTNALKHGGPATKAAVHIAYGPGSLDIEVSDDGRGAAGALIASPGSGQGLVGMRERVALLHGEMSAGPRRGGGYRVRTRIPLTTP